VQRASCGYILKLLQQDSKDISERETMEPAVFPSINLVAGDSETHSTLSRGESIGLAFDTEAGMFSALAASVLLSIIFVCFLCFLSPFPF
jgi:hypothetical protein